MEKFDKNIDWYFENWRDNFSDYIDDLLQIASNEVENKGLNMLSEKIQAMIETARIRRE